MKTRPKREKLSRLSLWCVQGTAGAIAVCVVLLSVPVAKAVEAETHVFNATLSLTGDCSVAPLDPVPDPSCPDGPPSGAFQQPRGIAIDRYGNRYVSSYGNESDPATEGRIDVFDSSGHFITEVASSQGPKAIAVDSKGNLYAVEHVVGLARIGRYSPTLYKPASGELSYDETPFVVAQNGNGEGDPDINGGLVSQNNGLVVNPLDDRLFQHGGRSIVEYGSAAEANKLRDSFGEETLENLVAAWNGTKIAIDAAHKRIYATNHPNGTSNLVHFFNLDPPHELLGTIDGSTTPAGKFTSGGTGLAVAVEEETGDVFVGDLETAKKIYEFEPDGSFVSTLAKNFLPLGWREIEVDNGVNSPSRGTLFVPSSENVPGRSLAFELIPTPDPPAIESLTFSGVTEEEAVLRAEVNPGGEETTYRFEYTTEQQYAAEEFTGALVVGEGTLAASTEGVSVSANLSELDSGTAYRFRVVAKNETGEVERRAPFATYGPLDLSAGCSNAALRTGASAELPDCRAYELVTPASTNGHAPIARGFFGDQFTSPAAALPGNKVSFLVEGGPIPGLAGAGGFYGDPYLATREATGWKTRSAGPDGTEAIKPQTGSASLDQGYSWWTAEGGGSASVDGKATSYVRYPDGHSELAGQGSMGAATQVEGYLISENGGHTLFSAAQRLEPEAAPDGTRSIYDRAADGMLRVVSLLPGDVPLGDAQKADFMGASLDGRGVVFSIGPTLYLRRDNAETYEVADNVTFAGVTAGGGRVFYVEDGDLLAFDVDAGGAVAFTEAGDVAVVNVADGGGSAYFVSPSVLSGPEGVELENPRGEVPQAGGENLYRSQEGQITFVGTVTERDVEGQLSNERIEGLGLWTSAVGIVGGRPGRLAIDPSRTTDDGDVLLFESRADLTAYDAEGHSQVYRFSAAAGTLDCLSCNPTLAAPSGDAHLQAVKTVSDTVEPLHAYTPVENLRDDGRRAFFESPEPLVLADTDGLIDVYEWEAEGVGSCRTAGGCVYLISSPSSGSNDYLYATSESGDDVFFRTSDLLLPASDPDETPSIYDARVDGGFPPPAAVAGECLGEACQPTASAPPELTPATFPTAGNLPPQARKPRCPKGKRRAGHRKKAGCVSKKALHRAKRKGRAGR